MNLYRTLYSIYKTCKCLKIKNEGIDESRLALYYYMFVEGKNGSVVYMKSWFAATFVCKPKPV